jgi:hypothetical protein
MNTVRGERGPAAARARAFSHLPAKLVAVFIPKTRTLSPEPENKEKQWYIQ